MLCFSFSLYGLSRSLSAPGMESHAWFQLWSQITTSACVFDLSGSFNRAPLQRSQHAGQKELLVSEVSLLMLKVCLSRWSPSLCLIWSYPIVLRQSSECVMSYCHAGQPNACVARTWIFQAAGTFWMIWMFRHPTLSIGVILCALPADMLMRHLRLSLWPPHDFLASLSETKCMHTKESTRVQCHANQGLSCLFRCAKLFFSSTLSILHLSESIDDKQRKIKAWLKVKAKCACVKPEKYERH